MNDLRPAHSELPDIPRWIYARGTLRSGSCRIFGHWPRGSGGVLLSRDWRLLCAVGRPSNEEVMNAVSAAPDGAEFVCEAAVQEHIGRMLTGWRFEWASLFVLETSRRPQATRRDCGAHLRRITADDAELIMKLPADLRYAVWTACRHSVAVAAIIDKMPVSFCYAPMVTETLWDIAVDTLPEFRRRCLASACADRLIRHMRTLGRSPVWGAMESNRASSAMAEKLGFRKVDKLAVFRKAQ